MYGNINELYKVTLLLSDTNRFNSLNMPVNLEHLITYFLYEHPNLGFLARLPEEDYTVGHFVYYGFIYFKEKISILLVSQFLYYIVGYHYV